MKPPFDDLVTKIVSDAAKKGIRVERERIARVYDHHMTGLVLEDENVRRRLNAFAYDLASGADPTRRQA
jgi:hypothetical protein